MTGAKKMKRALIPLLGLAVWLAGAVPAEAQGELRLPPYKRVKLKNGMTLLLMEQRELPIVSFSVLVRAGSTADPAGKEGTASVTAGLLRKGTKTRTADQLSAELDFIGGQLFAFAGYDFTTLSAEFLKKDLDKGFALLTDVLLNPTFPAEEVEKLLKQRRDQAKSVKDNPGSVIAAYFNAYLFGAHPYGRPREGDERSLAAIGREDVVKFYETNYVPGATILAAVGDFSMAEMEKRLTEKFAGWPAKAAPEVKLPEPAPVKGRRLLLVDKPDATQTFYRIGNVGIARANPDRVAIDVVNTLFGGRFTSWLNTELRVKAGYTYGISSFFDERKVRGPFAINSFTPNEKTQAALDLTLEVLKRFHEQGISEEELKSAKAYLKGQFPPQIETSDQLASLLTTLEFHGLDEREINELYTKIDALTLAEARRIIRQYFPLEDLVFVCIGKASEIESVLKKYAPVINRKSISDAGY
jgi:predicted Zn-dependent peptidase